MEADDQSHLVEGICLPLLREAQSADGGWGFHPGSSSRVEPTSFALLALEQAPKDLLPAAAARRRQLAESLLRDRMCPGGGWNCGNPRVYGVAGEPLVLPTAWALLALRAHPERPENVMSLE